MTIYDDPDPDNPYRICSASSVHVTEACTTLIKARQRKEHLERVTNKKLQILYFNGSEWSEVD